MGYALTRQRPYLIPVWYLISAGIGLLLCSKAGALRKMEKLLLSGWDAENVSRAAKEIELEI